MAVSNEVVSVGTTPTLLQNGDTRDLADIKWAEFVVDAGGVTVYIGGPNVTTANGRPIAPSGSVEASWSATINVGDSIYGVVASGSQNVRIIRSRV